MGSLKNHVMGAPIQIMKILRREGGGLCFVPHIRLDVFIPSGVEDADSEVGVLPPFTDGTEG